jgi:hypothetical protein
MEARHRCRDKATGPSQSPGDRRCARRVLLSRVVSQSSCMPCCATEPSSHRPRRFKPTRLDRRPHRAPARSDARGREQTTARIVLQPLTSSRLRFQPSRPAPSLPHQVPNEHAENAGTRKRRHSEEASALDPLENTIRRLQPSPSRKLLTLVSSREADVHCRRSAPLRWRAPDPIRNGATALAC